MISLNEELSRIELGQVCQFRKLTLIPLMRRQTATPEQDYLLLDDAIGQGLARVTELNGGSVPELRFENRADKPVLLLDGEELIGAKQNRVLNLTMLVPAKETIVIPVSCVEAGRWNTTSDEFLASDHVMYSRVRAARAGAVTASMRATGQRRSDQSAVWGDIALKSESLGVSSPTGAMAAMYERHSISVEEYVRAFAWSTEQAGVAFVIGGHTAGLDLFDRPAVLRQFYPKLVRSYALDALDAPEVQAETPQSQVVTDLLGKVAHAQSFAHPALGLGKDVRFSAEQLAGAALFALDRYIHICAFSTDQKSEQTQFSARMNRPSRRFV